ncbi:MAG: threonine synthase, partial [Candidatus Faecivivens sp.]|nr:threonine synthase [Candidatus Faecivivens sp.]
MNYNSTRDSSCKVTAAQAIAQGISHEGGLFVPETLPVLTREDLQAMVGMSYNEKAKAVLSRFLTDFTKEELDYCVDSAYNDRKFDSANISELAKVGDSAYLLELWHGPTCAFKDMALQLLPYLMTISARKTAPDKEIVVLVATSGDTGKAALEGFADVPHTRMLVFYPENGVSEMQKLQMTTQTGGNVSVCAIKGNFDDAQSGVKKIFTDPVIEAELAKNGQMFSSANSINWGRLVPQIVYYVAAYTSLVEQGEIELGETVNVTVPTGNFGNILAAYYAKLMGLPIGKLICASNKNKVLTDFIRTGTYDRNRDFYTTTSPSMDILISSNLERLLY